MADTVPSPAAQLPLTPRQAARAPAVVVPPYEIVVVRDPDTLADHLKAWHDLIDHALEPNIFAEPSFVLPALKTFGHEGEMFFVFVYAPINAQRREPELHGFFPLVRRRLHRLVPVTVCEVWQNVYGFLNMPLVRAGHEQEVIEGVFRFLAAPPTKAVFLRTELTPGDGRFGQALTEFCYRYQRPTFVVDEYVRAVYRSSAPVDDYLAVRLSRKRLKEFDKKEKLLAARGALARRHLAPGDDAAPWLDAFLRLEAEGWKGKEGSAMGAEPEHAAFFRSFALAAHARGQLMMLGLYLDDRPIAMKVNFLGRPDKAGRRAGSFAFKIAFDEAFAEFSPGVLLEIANMERLRELGVVAEMDSCAVPTHFMINRLWQERRVIRTALLATGRAPGDFLVSVMPLLRWFKRLFRVRRPADAAGPSESHE